MKTEQLRVATVAALLAAAALGCRGDKTPTSVNGPSASYGAASASAAQTATSFTVGKLHITGIQQSRPGDNWHLRDVAMNGPVAGDLTGNANLMLNSNMDAYLGTGPAWGTMTIVTNSGDVWQGNVTGTFRSGAPYGIQLFSQVVLHGPDSQSLRAECDETSVTSETLACTGEFLTPHG